MEHLKPLTTGEENLMKVIWDSRKIYLKDILSAYPEPKPHQNTISTFLKNLVEKNYLKTILEGRIFRYEMSVSKSVQLNRTTEILFGIHLHYHCNRIQRRLVNEVV